MPKKIRRTKGEHPKPPETERRETSTATRAAILEGYETHSQPELANKYGVHYTTVSRIIKRARARSSPLGDITDLVQNSALNTSPRPIAGRQVKAFSSTSHQYPYSPLDEIDREIRLINLLPGNFSDDIQVEIRKAFLATDTGSSCQYEALSYVWGSAQDPTKITVVVGKTKYYLEVTQNLARLLPYLRDKTQPRTLWIDAICINQQDLAERSQQVMRMEDIFAWANRVVVWLGHPTVSRSTAIAAMNDLGRRVIVNWHASTITWHEHEKILDSSPYMESGGSIDLETQIPYNEPTLEALSNLLGSEWFERLWVWQEIHLAGTNATLFCGHDHILWTHFRNAIFCIYTIRRRRNDLGSQIQRIFDFCDFAGNSGIPQVLRATRKLKCMDARDSIYAVQGMLHRIESGYRVLISDYSTESETAVYKDFVVRCIGSKRDLAILELCNLGQTAENLPTWVPDFSLRSNFDEAQLLYAFAATRTVAEVKFEQPSRLIVKGLRSRSTILSVQRSIPGERLEFWKTALMIRKFWVLILRHEDSDNVQKRIGPLCRTLVAGHFAESTEPPDGDLLSLSKYETGLLEVINGTSYQFSDETSEFLSFVWDYIQGRLLFLTDDGQFGLAPEAAQSGDPICVLKGSSLPFVLRPCDSEGRVEHQVVGPCYCSGLMDGEAFLGPLPSNQRIVDIYNHRLQAYIRVFLDTSTGQTQVGDPRLRPLPEGWTTMSHAEEDAYLRYVNEKTGEVGTSRLTSAILKERGIEIEDIVLV